MLPAIYFIGLQGSPLEIIGGVVDTPTLLTRTKGALNAHLEQLSLSQPAPTQTQVITINTINHTLKQKLN